MSHDVVRAMLLFMSAPAKSQSLCSAGGDLVQLLQRKTEIGHSAVYRAYVTAAANNLSQKVLSNSAPKAVAAEHLGHSWSSGSVEPMTSSNSSVVQSSHIVSIPKQNLSVIQVRDSEAQFGHAQTHSSESQNLKSGLTFGYITLLMIAAIVLIIALCVNGSTIEDPKPGRPQVPPIPGWPIPSQQSPPKVMLPSQPLLSSLSSQMSLSTVSESIAQVPPVRSGTGLLSIASINTTPCRSASFSPPPKAPAAGPAFASSGLHYLLTARGDGASTTATSIRTPSPFRTSIAALVSPRANANTLPSATFPPPVTARSDRAALLAAPPLNAKSRATTASQQGLTGVQGRVQWYTLGTPRPPEGFTTLPTPRPRY